MTKEATKGNGTNIVSDRSIDPKNHEIAILPFIIIGLLGFGLYQSQSGASVQDKKSQFSYDQGSTAYTHQLMSTVDKIHTIGRLMSIYYTPVGYVFVLMDSSATVLIKSKKYLVSFHNVADEATYSADDEITIHVDIEGHWFELTCLVQNLYRYLYGNKVNEIKIQAPIIKTEERWI